MPDQEYRRLTFARLRRSGFIVARERVSLWLGRDHLLCVITTGYTETYKRFYFRDIQSIDLQRTTRRMTLNIILAVITAIFGLIDLAIGNSAGWGAAIVFGSLAAVFPLLMLINALKGPTTVCHLRTAVQTEELTPLNRLGRAHKILDRLRPLIAEAQGRMAPEEVQTLMTRMSASGGAMPPYPQPPVGASAAPGGPDGLPVA